MASASGTRRQAGVSCGSTRRILTPFHFFHQFRDTTPTPALALPVAFVSCEVKFHPTFSRETLELIGKERAPRFRDSSHSVLVPSFRQSCANQLFGDRLSNQPVESSRVLVPAYLQHFDNETTDANLLCGRRSVVCRLLFRMRFSKIVNV
jgi:hypothetical protein